VIRFYDIAIDGTREATQADFDRLQDVYQAFATRHEGEKALAALSLAVGQGKFRYDDAMKLLKPLFDWARVSD